MLRRSRFPVCAFVLVAFLSVVPGASADDFSSQARSEVAAIFGRLWRTLARLVAPPVSVTASVCSDSGSIMDPNGCPRG
jgi:hypothetical protein